VRSSRLVATVVILLALVIVSCSGETATPTPQGAAPPRGSTPRLMAPEAEILPGEGLGFAPASVGTPEADPKLLLHVAPRDESTRQRVTVPITSALG
jgi:hypothetical protein